MGFNQVVAAEPLVLVPPLIFQEVRNSSAGAVNVIGYGRANGTLYLQVRLRESIDLSLKKGWGKAFQLVDSQGHGYRYDSYSLPSGVHVYDPLVDLPDDLRARQTVLPNGYKDLYLCFPQFPANAVPSRLNIIEAFQGNSPANPGITYDTIEFVPVGPPREQEALLALDTLFLDLRGLSPLSINDHGVEITCKTLELDEQLFPRLTITSTHQASDVYLLDSLLVDQTGRNYGMLQLEEFVKLEGNEEEVQLTYERLPHTARIKQVWFKISVGGTEYELLAEL